MKQSSQNKFNRATTMVVKKLLLLWPLNPIVLIFIAPFLPNRLYLNRGYTVWYHLITLSYLLTNKEPLRRFLIMQGSAISLGWYAAMINDVCLHGRFAHMLYMNMPRFMKTAMVDETGHVFYTYNSVAYMAVSHVFDTFLHPGIVFLLYKAHCRAGGKFRDILSWNVIFATFAMSRLWSFVHTHHNQGEIGAWYFGYDVYHIHTLDCWMPAYITEGACIAAAIIYKVLFLKGGRRDSIANVANVKCVK